MRRDDDERQDEARRRWRWPCRGKRSSENRSGDRLEGPDLGRNPSVAQTAEEVVPSATEQGGPLLWEATAGVAYLELIREQLDEERSRKASLESRGVFVVTSAGALVTLGTAFLGSAEHARRILEASSGRGLLLASLAAFVVAVAAGIATNLPLKYTEPKPSEIREAVITFWAGDRVEAAKQNALTWIDTLSKAREMNKLKGRFLSTALVAEGIAFTCLAVAAGAAIWS